MPACPNCGRDNPADVRFCGGCGTDLSAMSVREVRKAVTILFTDLAGSTALGERIDQESLRRLMSRYFDAMREVIERHGGRVEKFIGDAIMAVFGIPNLHEDDALRALRAAYDMRGKLASLNDEFERTFGVRIQTRTGVNTGEVVTRDDADQQLLATGDAVNLAARLEQTAPPGEILIGDRTRRLAGAAIDAEPLEPLALKGKIDPVHAHRLLNVHEGAAAFERRFDARLVGRRAELLRLRAAFDAAVFERRCRLVAILGAPGIGKTRLARELTLDLCDEATVLTGRCLPYGEGITYWPLREIFTAARAEDRLDAALEETAPEDVFWTVRKLLEERARERPHVLVLDDIQWAEQTLLDLIEHVTDWTRDAPLLLVCLSRPELVDLRPGWTVRTQADTIALDPLNEAESAELIEGLVEGADLDAGTRSRILEVAAGNPLFVEQLLAMIDEGGAAEQVPDTITALLAARLDTLPAEERDLLERASVVGLEFEWEALGDLTADRRRPPGAPLASLSRKGLISPHELIADTFRFRHILVRDAAYDRLPKETRADLHERFADWLDGRGEEFQEIIGYHLEQAHRWRVELGPQDDRAKALATRAAENLAASGRRAYARGDVPATINLLDRATPLFPREDLRLFSALTILGKGLTHAGETTRAREILSEAVRDARSAGEFGEATDATVALAYLMLHTDPLTSHEVVLSQMQEAIGVYTATGNEGGIARAMGVAGMVRFWIGEVSAAMEELQRAAEHAQNAGDRAQAVENMQYALLALQQGREPVDAAIQRLAAMTRVAEGNRRLEMMAARVQGQLEAMRGDFEKARELIGRAKTLAEELGLRMFRAAGALQAAGCIELLAGDYPAAESLLREAYESLEEMGDVGHLTTVSHYLAEALFEQDRGEEAAAMIEFSARSSLKDDIDAQIGWRRSKAKLLARRGVFDEALHLAREAVDLGRGTEYLDLQARTLTDLGEVLRLAGRADDAAAALEEALRLHDMKGNTVAAGRIRMLLAQPPVGA